MRCDTLVISGIPNEASSITLTIDSLAAYPREGEFCEADYLDRVNAELAEYNPELIATCITDPGIGGLELVSWPEDMERWEAENILYSDEIFMNLQGIEGPWIFAFSIK